MRKLSLRDMTEHRIARMQHPQLATHKLRLRPWERGTEVVSEPGDQRGHVLLKHAFNGEVGKWIEDHPLFWYRLS